MSSYENCGRGGKFGVVVGVFTVSLGTVGVPVCINDWSAGCGVKSGRAAGILLPPGDNCGSISLTLLVSFKYNDGLQSCKYSIYCNTSFV